MSEVAACFAEQERPQIAIGLLEGTSAFDSVCPVAQLAPQRSASSSRRRVASSTQCHALLCLR